ncbi:hypothetical protein SEA_VERSE_48 [Streptomyces phage Verse]|uniref:Uncharacterized protein n=2 Tax=Streptomyces phage Amela TaxID=1673877 RepID=A0A0K1YAD7_9CAUD|nr:hypothetical protein SEA_VERSE_48 [Streptomyces phage Verse]
MRAPFGDPGTFLLPLLKGAGTVGVTRKMMSATTFGLVDWKSDKERMAASARKTKRAAKKTNKLLKEQNKILKQQAG